MRHSLAPLVLTAACSLLCRSALAQDDPNLGEPFVEPGHDEAAVAPVAAGATVESLSPIGAAARPDAPPANLHGFAQPAPVPPQYDGQAPGGPRAGDDAPRDIRARRILHGFRMGYLYVMNSEHPTQSPNDASCPNCSLEEKYDLRTPHQFLIGYELMARLVGKDWLNVILVGNVIASGLEQSRFFPSANALVGFELDQSFQLGVGANFTLEEQKAAHMILAAGWTPEVGGFYVPVHAFFIPDVDKNHRTGVTVGVNW